MQDDPVLISYIEAQGMLYVIDCKNTLRKDQKYKPPDSPGRTGWESGRLCQSPGHRRSLTASNYVVVLSQNQKSNKSTCRDPSFLT